MAQGIDCFAIQPFMRLEDYLSASAFHAKIADLMEQTVPLRTPGYASLVVFPEDLATFLAVVDQGPLLNGCRTFTEALHRLARPLGLPLLPVMWHHRTLSVSRAFLTWVAPKVWRTWYGTFSELARRYRSTVVAGSALLPPNRFGYDTPEWSPASAEVYNLSIAVGDDGHTVSWTRKVNLVPTQEDVLHLSSERPGNGLHPFSVADTTVATAICYDAFTVPHTPHEPTFCSLVPLADEAGVRVLAQPSANPWPWQAAWALDPRRIRKDQWREEGAEAALGHCRSLELVINPMLLMHCWDLHFDGQSRIFQRHGKSVEVLAQSAFGTADPVSETVLHVAWDPSTAS